MAGLKSSTSVKDSSQSLILLMLEAKATPIIKPKKVPKTPIDDPQIRKIRMIPNFVMPRVRRSAMFLFLSLTNIIMLEIILKTATKIIKVKMKNMTVLSTFKASMKPELALCQSEI